MANLTNPFQATAFPTMNKNFLGNAFNPIDTSGDSKSFPGLTVNEENEIFLACDNANMTQYERNLLANDLYKKKIEQKNSEKKNQEKAAAHLELVNKAAITTDPKTKNSLNNTARKHEVADMIRNYVMNANGKDLTDVDDGQLIHDFSQENQQAAMAIDEFINGNESSSYFSKKMGFSQQDEEKEQSGFEQWLTGLGDRFQAFGRGVDNLLSKGQSAVDESGVDLNAYTKYIQDKYGVSYPAKLDKATRDKEYATVKENPEILKPYMTSTADDVLDVAEGGVDIAFSSFNPYATAAFTTAGGLESLMGGGALTWFGEKMGGIGSVINELPGLSQFRDSLSEENQARFDQFVANSALGLMLGVKNKSNIYKNPKQFLVENLQPNQITKNFMENVVGISEKAYNGIQRAGNFARGIEGGSLSKMASRMTNGLDGLSEWGAEKLTRTSSAQDKLYKAQEPRMNVLSEKKNLEQRRANSDRANQLIVENGYKPTNTSERLQAHDATLKKLWNDVLTEVNKGEGVFADQSSIINSLEKYINEQKELGIDASKADIKALEGELNAMKKQQAKGELDFPTLEKKKQVYNDLIDWKGTEASEVYKKGIKLITSEIGKLEDAMLSEIPGEFSQLKRDVGALIDTYEDVFKADMKNQRKKGLGLTETYSRLEGISDTLGGIFQLFKGDVSGVARGLSKVALGKAMAKATDVDFLVKKGFEELSKSFDENQVSSKTAPKIQEGIKTDQAVFDELSNYILDVNKEYSAEDISALGEMIDKSRKSLSREDYQTLKDALREQIQNRDLAIEEAEWLRTEGKAIEMGEDIKAVKEFQKRILEIEEQEKNIGKVAGKKVNRTYADQQMRAWESKRERLIKELEEYYNIDQFEAAAKYDELLERANINDFRKDSNRGKYQVADESGKQYKQYKLNGKERADYEKLAKGNRIFDREQTLDGLKYDIILSKERGYDIGDELFIQRKVAEDGIKRIQESIDTGKGYWVGGDNFVTDKAVLNKLMDEKKKIIDYIDNFDESTLKEYNGLGLSEEKISQQINSKEFKDFIGDSIAKNTDGTPKDLYHGTTDGGFTVFDINRSGRNANKLGPGIYLSNEPKVAREYTKHMNQETGKLYKEDYDTPEIMKVYARLENPLMIDKELIDLDAVKKVLKEGTKEYFFDNEIPFFLNGKIELTKDQIKALPKDKRVDLYVDYLSKGNDIQDINKELLNQVSRAYRDNLEQGLQNLSKATGKDGVFFEKGGSEQYVLWNNSQVKSATDNIGTFDRNNSDIRFQKYGTAGQGEKGVNAIQGLNIRNFKNGKSVKELANNYGIKTHIVDSISTPEGQKAYGMYGDKVITLARDLKESTVPHELLHATFDMVDSAKRTKILEGIQKRLKVDDIQAEEWLADNFSEYYRTGKFDTKAVPTTLAGQIKQFFQQIKEFIDGTYANRKEITQLFDDIIDGKIEGEYGVYSDPKFQSVWHGSHADFDRFDSSHMGEGEGAQAHGWGHYVAVEERTGRHYAELNSKMGYAKYKGEPLNDMYRSVNLRAPEGEEKSLAVDILTAHKDYNLTIPEAIKKSKGYYKNEIKKYEDFLKDEGLSDMHKTYKSLIEKYKKKIDIIDNMKESDFAGTDRNLYNVDIPDPKKADTPTGSNYLDEEGKLTEKQSDELITKAYNTYNEKKGLKPFDKITMEGVEKIGDEIVKDHQYNATTFDYKKSFIDGVKEKVADGYSLPEAVNKELKWFSGMSSTINKRKQAAGFFDTLSDEVMEKFNRKNSGNGEGAYKYLTSLLGSDKAASKALESIGYDGIHYFGGRDGEAYVIFNDDALKINSHEQY